MDRSIHVARQKAFIKWCSALLVILPLAVVLPHSANAAGPWRGWVVNAETGDPLEGVVVLGVWWKYSATVAGWANRRFYDSEEAVIEPDGKFRFKSRWIINWLPLLSKIEGPVLYIFKPGYGRWQLEGMDEWRKLGLRERNTRIDKAWESFAEGKGISIEIPPLKTREERIEYFNFRTSLSSKIPDSLKQGYLKAIEREGKFLGLK